MSSKVLDDINHSFSNFNGATVEVLELPIDFVQKILLDVINHPCWYYS